MSSNFIETSIGTRIRLGVSDQSAEFTQTANSIKIAVGTSNQEFSFIKSTLGELLFEEVKGKDSEIVSARRALSINIPVYVEIAPPSNESYQPITPSTTATYEEIIA